MGVEHFLRVERLVKFFLAHDALFYHDVIYRATCGMRLLRHLATFLITNDRIEGGHDADAVLHHLIATLLVHGNAQDAL